MVFTGRVWGIVAGAALAGLVLGNSRLCAQQKPGMFSLPASEASEIALPLPEDRGAAALVEALRRLRSTASVLMIVAHPDDEDGALLTYLSRGLGARTTLLTLTRGEGGQNAMGEDAYDALGLIRTNELLKAGEYYGVKQLWGTEADFGFSKTQEEAFAKWGHQRVLYDAVLAVRRERPQIILSTFVGGVSDGHGHHQVSGEIAQEAFKAAADPHVFPEQLKGGLHPWQAQAVYSMVPFAQIKDGKIFDYATGKWAPARFKNYVTGESTDTLSTDVTIPVGQRDPVLGRSYLQIAREGWGMQKSQNGGASPALSGPATTSYHLWAVAPGATPQDRSVTANDDLFRNSKVQIGAGCVAPEALSDRVANRLLLELQSLCEKIKALPDPQMGEANLEFAKKIAPIYSDALQLHTRLLTALDKELAADEKDEALFELDWKIDQFQHLFEQLLGLDLIAFTTHATRVDASGSRGASVDETPQSVSPGEKFKVHIHAASATAEAYLINSWLTSQSGDPWQVGQPLAASADRGDVIRPVEVPENAAPTQPYFTRPTIEQSYYDLSRPELRERSFAPYPLEAWAEFSFDGLPIRIGQVVQTLKRSTGYGGIYEPLLVTPAIGVRMEPQTRILPLDGSALPVKVTVHTEAAAEGTVTLKLPAGWRANPQEAKFSTKTAGDAGPIVFQVSPESTAVAGVEVGSYAIRAIAHSDGKDYETGWRSVGYAGLRPYNLYKMAELKTRKVDVKVAPGLRVGYVMGTGDEVPEALAELGLAPHLLTNDELTSGDLSAWNVLVIGIRAYSVRPALTSAQPRLDEFVRKGGTLLVQYQSEDFPAPLPLSVGRAPERVVDEAAPVKLLDPENELLSRPNRITTADFDGWVEERGHSFLGSWDAGYMALTETADPGQDPQRGGLLIAHPGKGTYIYAAFALYRQLPELVPGSYRLLANLVSAGQP